MNALPAGFLCCNNHYDVQSVFNGFIDLRNKDKCNVIVLNCLILLTNIYGLI